MAVRKKSLRLKGEPAHESADATLTSQDEQKKHATAKMVTAKLTTAKLITAKKIH